MHAPFTQFADLCERLAETGSKLQKRALMAEYLRALPVGEAGLAALYLAGVPFPETDGRALHVGGAVFSRVLAQLSGASPPECMPPTCVMATWVARRKTFYKIASVAPTLLLLEVAEAFAAIAGFKTGRKTVLHPGPAQEGHTARSEIPDQDHPGGYAHRDPGQPGRGGDSRGYGAPVGDVRRARMLNGNLPEVLELAATGRAQRCPDDPFFHPLGFMLASRSKR